MKHLLVVLLLLLSTNKYLSAQQKIEADLKIITFLGKVPYKTEKNAPTESLLNILYYKPQPKNYPKIGFMDTKGRVKIKPIYSMASDFYGGYANIIRDSIYGYIDKKGTEVLFKQYKEIYFYYGDIGIAKKDGNYGLIDRKGNPLTDFKYNMISFFGFNNFRGLLSPGKLHLLNNKGKVIFNKNLQYSIRSHFFEKDSLIVVQKISNKNSSESLVTLNDKIIVDSIYDKIQLIGDKELILVQKNKKFGYINKFGQEIIPTIYEQGAFQITENLICLKKNDKWGYVNRKNEIIIPFDYDEAYPFFSGKAFVKKGNFYGVIGTNNKTIVEFTLEKTDLPFYSNDLSVYKKGNKFGYINENGKVVIPAIYDFAFPFVNKLAYVELNRTSGFINRKGKEVIPIRYNQLWLPSEKLLRFVE